MHKGKGLNKYNRIDKGGEMKRIRERIKSLKSKSEINIMREKGTRDREKRINCQLIRMAREEERGE